jgi:hypothetical protein
MKLKFMRSADNGIVVKLVEGGIENEFNYIELIKFLHTNKSLEDPEFIGDISEEEQQRIIEMILSINEAAVAVETSLEEI